MIRTSGAIAVLAAAALTLALAGCHPGSVPTGSKTGVSSAAPGGTRSSNASPTATAGTPAPTPAPGPSVPAQNPAPPGHPLPPATAVNEADYEVPSFGASGPAFDSPSGNLQCGILIFSGSGGYWGCSATDHSWVFASAAPGDPCYNSEVSCGHGIEAQLGGSPGVLKAGDIQFPGSDPDDYPTKALPYGESVSYHGVTCVSASDGVTCIDASSGHGFQISQSKNDIF